MRFPRSISASSFRGEAGATASEYAVMVALIAATMIFSVVFLGRSGSETFQCTGTAISIRKAASDCAAGGGGSSGPTAANGCLGQSPCHRQGGPFALGCTEPACNSIAQSSGYPDYETWAPNTFGVNCAAGLVAGHPEVHITCA